MYKSKFGILIDSLVLSIITLLISFGWLNKIIKNAKYSLFIANIVTFVVFLVYFLLFSKKNKANHIASKELKLFENSLAFLAYTSSQNTIDYFSKLLNAKHLTNNFFESDNFYFYININTVLSANDFHSANQFMLESKKQKSMIFISEETSEEFKKHLSNSPVKFTLFTNKDLALIMKIKNCYPVENSECKNFKHLAKNKISKFSKSLNKKQFKNFFFSGISLIIFSFFVPYNFLYLITGSFLLILSSISLFKNNNPSAKNEITPNDLFKK